MIKFFRHIRRSLLNENKMGKYFKYAIGEILLVVIGILIALQVNNWNEKRKQSDYEKQLLSQLKLDFNRNINDIKFNIKLQNRIINSSKLILQHLENKQPYHDSLSAHFGTTVLWTKFIVNEGAYKSIESQGLDIISDLELRDLTFRIFEDKLNWLRQMENTIIDLTEDFRKGEAAKYFTALNPIVIKDGRFADGWAQLIDYPMLLSEEGQSYILYLNTVINETEILLSITKSYLDEHEQGITKIDSILNFTAND
ncbi:DUF6090 family protein [Ichthyenterobacterium sp. W332]|uniref:DUF6090 family protein n=1 Tax=Microcosmobacter mediterraneus TaxID=3075607 RepID=A0ABU2YJE3_9FLAO|nr:DUF6090 family protein [Ichthyenterobacterium sp. W332]MDT0558292.1 DUF6090 family protein [Ichthyenterobacterium sp. W332]